MADAIDFSKSPLQDRDLLLRMSWYFDSISQKLKQGEGWLIFNADQMRSKRIATFIRTRLAECEPPVDAFMLSWRDFALNAYVNEIGIPQLEPEVRSRPDQKRIASELAFARKVNDQVWDRCATTELLMVTDLRPQHAHEIDYLDRAVEERYRQRLATIIVTPEQPREFTSAEEHHVENHEQWERLFARMYETCLVAM